MRLRVTQYLDVISSWCFWAFPAWQELQERYRGRVEFNWKIALMDAAALPPTEEATAWYYRRSGMIMQSPFMLSTGWYEGLPEYLAPNCVAEAGKDFGVTDDRIWSAISAAGVREGKKHGRWEIAAGIGARAGGLNEAKLLERARDPAVEERVRASTAEFHALQVNQRPTFVIESEIGDRAIFAGFARVDPLAAALEAMLEDLRAYQAHAAHFGAPPA